MMLRFVSITLCLMYMVPPTCSQSNEPAICDGGSGTLLPAFNSQGEADWPNGLKVVLYLTGLLYAFLGVSIVADIFMGAIEMITSRQKLVKLPDGEEALVTVWNATVANLSLMALGSSAPEILLSIIEIVSNNFYSGALGPSTIVGSAAFNLLFIIAVCTVAIPKGELRRIANFNVFLVTAIASLFAYFWLLVILVFNTKDVIDVWEGVLTLIFFPLLLVLAFGADQGWFNRSSVKTAPEEHITSVTTSTANKRFRAGEVAKLIKAKNVKIGALASNSDEQTCGDALTPSALKERPIDYSLYRRDTIRWLTGGKKLIPQANEKLERIPMESLQDFETGEPTISFLVEIMSVLENRECNVIVQRTGPAEMEASVAFRTQEGSAKEGEDFIAASGRLVFGPGERIHAIKIALVDNDEPENDESFKVIMADPSANVKLGKSVCDVIIVDDDSPGVLSLTDPTVQIPETIGTLKIPVVRSGGAGGEVSVSYKTTNGTAYAGRDFKETEGTLTFAEGETVKTIDVVIVNDEQYEKEEVFRLVLIDPKGTTVEQDFVEITIISDDLIDSFVDKVTAVLNLNLDRMHVGSTDWKEQFGDALSVPLWEEGKMSYIMACLSMPWRLFFALIPPTVFAGGWATFCISLMFIGLVTALISDLASLMGCAMGLKDTVTAITFVALGTSLPDTFASKAAAVNDRTADAAIGNVTGSNSVNVYLGLGLPWAIAAIYWHVQGATSEWVSNISAIDPQLVINNPGGAFIVSAGDLSFSVIVFSCCSLACFALMFIRRVTVGGELGGPGKMIIGGFLAFLWLLYVLLSSLRAYGHI